MRNTLKTAFSYVIYIPAALLVAPIIMRALQNGNFLIGFVIPVIAFFVLGQIVSRVKARIWGS